MHVCARFLIAVGSGPAERGGLCSRIRAFLRRGPLDGAAIARIGAVESAAAGFLNERAGARNVGDGDSGSGPDCGDLYDLPEPN